MNKVILPILWIIFMAVNAIAQLPAFWANATVDSTSGTVGDIFKLNLVAVADSSLSVAVPSAKDGFGEFQVLSTTEPSIEDSNGYRLYKLSYEISAYKTGGLYLPSISIKAADSKGAEYTASTDSIRFEIQSVLPAITADSLLIKDIKPIFEFPIPAYYYVIIALVTITVAMLIYLYIRHRKKKSRLMGISEKPADPPWVAAAKMLDYLKNQRFLERGEFRQFFFALSEIGKFYADKRFNFPAIEKTTFEIIGEFDNHQPVALDARFIEFLKEADLVKFAKCPSSIAQGNGWLDYVEDLIITTKPSDAFISPPKINSVVEQ